ncbi:UDP-glycosyltransferase 73C5 [Capsicum chinense]|nr:UDP-glycosyltransferase 73C5 [Capsicum chinense]
MAQGHMIPMIDVARLLAQHGVIITILITHSNAVRFKTVVDRAVDAGLKIQVAHLDFPSLEVGLPEGCENFDMLPSIGKKIWTIGPVSFCDKEKQDKAERGNKASIDEHKGLKWLDSWEQDSVLFVCLGSLSRLSTSQMIELGLGLQSSKRPFIWVVRHMSDEFRKWLAEENFEERIKRQGLLIHGISAGVPMITWPLFAEQFCNERLIVNVLKTGLKAGMENPVLFGEEEKLGAQVSKDLHVKMVIEEVMGEEMEAEKRRKRAKELGEKAMMAVEEGGSSHLNLTQLIQHVTEQANF